MIKGIFNVRARKDNNKKFSLAVEEGLKALKSKTLKAHTAKKQQKQTAQKKKKAGDLEEDELKKPKEMTRNDYRIMSEMKHVGHTEKNEGRLEQLEVVQQLKRHLARNNMNISADVLERGILMPEEDNRDELEDKNYPRIIDQLLINPFAQTKKAKKGKKKKH